MEDKIAENLKKLNELLGKYAGASVGNLYPEAVDKFVKKERYPAAGPAFCVHCLSKNIYEVFSHSEGTVAGGTTDSVLWCEDCGGYTTTSHDWG